MKEPCNTAFSQLVDLVEDRLPDDDRARLLTHAVTCTRCAATVTWLERMLVVMRTDDTEPPPPQLVDRVRRAFRERSIKAPPHWRRQITAILRFDSAWSPLPAGVRAVGFGTRQRLFGVEEYDIDVRMVPTNQGWKVFGQILGSTGSGSIEMHSPSAVLRTELNELSEFVLTQVPPGMYTLSVLLPDVELMIDAFEVGM